MQMYNNCIDQETKKNVWDKVPNSTSQYLSLFRLWGQWPNMCTFFSTFLQTLNLVIQVFYQLKPNQPNCQKLYMMKMLTISVSNKRHEAVADVSRVVHSQTNGYHQVDAGHNVDREAPQVHDTSHIHLQKGDFNCYKKNCF